MRCLSAHPLTPGISRSQVFQSISKDIMQRLAATQDAPSASGAIRVGDTPGGPAKKAACCSS